MTEAELLAMREVQAKATKGPWFLRQFASFDRVDVMYDSYGAPHWLGAFETGNDAFMAATARTDWPRVTEWAIEVRRLLAAYRAGKITDGPMLAEVKRLLGE